MKKRVLGKTGLEVTELALGGLFISSFGGEFEKSREAALKALESGINYIDTAPGYFNSEEVLGKILKEFKPKESLIISTKLGGRPMPFEPKNKKMLKDSVKTSLKNLNREYIDVLMIHEPDRPGQYDWWDDMYKADGPVMEVIEELKQDGLIKYSGLGGTSAYQLARVIETGKFDVVLTAFNYSLLFREAENEIIPLAKKNGMGIVIGSPLQQGSLAKRYDKLIEEGPVWMSKPRQMQYKALYKYLDEIEMSLPEAGLRFALSNKDISTVLTGARAINEVEMNIKAANKGALPDEVLNRFAEIAAMVPFRPSEEPMFLPFNREYNGLGAL